jgi:quercetin dioxygenase-like cupin family protein
MQTPSSPELRPEDPGRRIDASLATFDVPLELARLRSERAYELEGHAGRTLTKYPDIRVVLETMKRGARMTLHETAERITLSVVIGLVRIRLEGGETADLSEGAFCAIERSRVHEIECLDECAFLLTLAWPPAGREALDFEPVEI